PFSASSWVGPSGRTSRSTIVGPLAVKTTLANTRRNWWRLRRTSSSRRARRLSSHYSARHAPCRSCSCSYLIRLVQVLSPVWLGQGAISPGLPSGTTAWPRNGSHYDRMRRREFSTMLGGMATWPRIAALGLLLAAISLAVPTNATTPVPASGHVTVLAQAMI